MFPCCGSLIVRSSEELGWRVHLAVGDTHAGRDVELGGTPSREFHLINPVAAFVADSCRGESVRQ